MKGIVDSGGRSLLTVVLRSHDPSTQAQVDVWIDTGFTDDLVIPQSAIDTLDLPRSGSIDAVLANGSQKSSTRTVVLSSGLAESET